LNSIQILYIGNEDWTTKYNIPDFVEWENYEDTGIFPPKQVDIVILDRDITNKEKQILAKITRAYSLFATENVKMQNSVTHDYFEERSGLYLYSGDVQVFLDQEAAKYYRHPYGEKFKPEHISVSQFFRGSVRCKGNYDMLLEGDFGDTFSQIVFWKSNIPVFDRQNIDLYFEHRRTGSVEVKLHVYKFYNGSVGDIQRVWEFSQDELDGIVTIDNDELEGPVFVSVLAKGQGTLEVISLHDRYSRQNIGYFLPGGERIISSQGEEIFTYLDKGDCKPPLAIYFSGYRKQEGFEGYNMMRKLGCPFMLITDPRLEGGAFYIDNADLEEKLFNNIEKTINEMKLKKSDVIISGMSMGTFGSLYFGSKLSPHALILAKPLTELGVVAENERLLRPGVFPTSLDLLLKNYGSLSKKSVEEFDKRMWERFDKADWSHTKFIASYLYEDDYDTDGYKNILEHLKSEGVEVYGKGSHGHHNDNRESVVGWFLSQYRLILEEDFNRK